jgi:hypothetical protein
MAVLHVDAASCRIICKKVSTLYSQLIWLGATGFASAAVGLMFHCVVHKNGKPAIDDLSVCHIMMAEFFPESFTRALAVD